MGKKLIIKGADFSENALDNTGSITDITSQLVSSDIHRQYIHMPSANQLDQFQYSADALATSVISTLDVSGMRGKTIIANIYGITNDSSAYQMCFASSVNVAIPWNGTTLENNAVTSVERITGKGTGGYGTYTLVVPQSANYLVFKNRTNYPATIYLEE